MPKTNLERAPLPFLLFADLPCAHCYALLMSFSSTMPPPPPYANPNAMPCPRLPYLHPSPPAPKTITLTVTTLLPGLAQPPPACDLTVPRSPANRLASVCATQHTSCLLNSTVPLRPSCCSAISRQPRATYNLIAFEQCPFRIGNPSSSVPLDPSWAACGACICARHAARLSVPCPLPSACFFLTLEKSPTGKHRA